MAIFGTEASSGAGAVTVHGFAVAVSKWTAAAADAVGAIPTYGAWAVVPELKAEDVAVNSSVVGMSGARLTLALGAPVSSLDVEDSGTLLRRGDRVLIGIVDEPEGDPRWVFGGYVTRYQMTIGGERESANFKVVGPEWFWGEGGGAGAGAVVRGQTRRKASAEDAWLVDPATVVTGSTGWEECLSEWCVFNPGGRPNMSSSRITVFSAGGTDYQSHIFELPDRKLNGVTIAQRWTIKEAIRYLFTRWNPQAFSGIDDPVWADVTAIPDGEILGATSVEGMGLYAALRAVCGPKYGFLVSPMPGDGAAMAWGSFQVHFYARGAGEAAALHLDERFTPASAATPSVTRLDLTADIAKTVNKIRVYGRRLIHVSLRYRGDDTPDHTTNAYTLQHGWATSEGDLDDYAKKTNPFFDPSAPASPTNPPNWAVTGITIDSLGKKAEWHDRYCTTGKDFPKHQHVFRLFVWNEAREWHNAAADADADKPVYMTLFGEGRAVTPWFAPDVATVWGAAAGSHHRRRRPMVDGKWLDTTVSGWRRLPPSLFMAFKKFDGTLSPWYRVSTSKYRLDEERAAVWITAEDLAEWLPFDQEQNFDLNLPNDPRSFATLLGQGVLRLALEGCIEHDSAELGPAPDKPADTGSPFYRQANQRAERQFTKIEDAAGGDGFILSATGAAVDDTAAALSLAQTLLDGAKDAQVHSSILVAADWPEQAIGKTVATISGRNISLLTGQGGLTGRPAQIVAYRMDFGAMKWELLTESAALALKDTLRRAALDTRGRQAAIRRDVRASGGVRQSELNRGGL